MKRAGLPDFSSARGRRLLVALSGGADSVALLCMLHEKRESLNLTLAAAHVDHCIRGAESRADAEYCLSLCRKLDIPICVRTIDVPAIARQTGEGLETAARRLRYDALRQIRAELGAEWIALAHHLNDQAETVLMHMMRGCGPEGVCGMSELSGDLYRPLLNTPKAALENWLQQRDIAWREDRTNLDPFTPRNALRLHVLPALEESYPKAAEAIARYAQSAQCENRLMNRLTDEFLAERLQSVPCGIRLLHPDEADEAILRRALRRICAHPLSSDRLTELTGLCRRKRGRMVVSGSLTAERTPDAIYFLQNCADNPQPTPLPEEGSAAFGSLGRFTVKPSAKTPITDDPYRQVLDADALQGAVIRTRRDGDRFRPLGCGDRKLSDCLIDKKIDRPLRDHIPLVAVGSRVLWIIGFGISQDVRLRPDTQTAIELCWEPNFITSDKSMEGINHGKGHR